MTTPSSERALAAFRPTIYSLGYGQYPSRIHIYLAEKGMTSDFIIKRATVLPDRIVPPEGMPKGTYPVLEYEPGKFIKQSTAILEYLEDVYSTVGPDMFGDTPLRRAKVRECRDIINEACIYFGVYVLHASAFFHTRHQSQEVAEDTLARVHQMLQILSKLAMPAAQGPMLAGGEQPTIADIMLAGLLQYASSMYAIDLVENHGRLQVFKQAFMARESVNTISVPQQLAQETRVMSQR